MIKTFNFLIVFLTFAFCLLTFPKLAFAANSGIFTAEAWVKPTSSIASQAILGKSEELRIFTDASGFVGCQIKSTTWQTASTGTTNALSLNTWAHVACAYDKANLRVYVNGVQVATQALTTAPDDTAAAIEIGEDDSASTPYSNLTGTVDNFQFYNYARTGKQVVSDMNAGHPNVGSPVGSAVTHWKLDEGYSTTANDSTPNTNSLTLSSASWTDSGKFGKAWNGTGALWLSKADDSDFDVAATDDYSVSLWFKTDSATNPGAIEYLFNKANATTAGYGVYVNTSGQFCFGIDDDASWGPDVGSCTSTDVYDNTWHHLTGVRDTTLDKTYIYIDGVLKDSDTDSTTATLANSLSLYIGDRDGTDNGDEFNGDLDEIKVYRYALTADEVKTEYNRGSSLVLGALGNLSTLSNQASAQEYCVPGDSSTCTAPVGRWDFEEGGGNSVNDTSGNANTGTWNGTGSHWTTGKVGKGGNFNGTNDYVSIPTISLTSITVEAWFKSSNNSQNGFIVMKNPVNQQWGLFFEGGGLRWRANDPNDQLTASPTPSVNNWHHVAVTQTGTTATMYIDGVFNGTRTMLTSIGNGAGLVNIGRYDSGYYFNGFIDQVRVFNYARSAAQVAYDYNRGKPVGYWKFDECQNSTAYDSSGNSNTGTITIGVSGTQTAVGNCNTNAATAWYNGNTGKRNYSLNFDGTDDYVYITDTAKLRFNDATNDFSLFAWVKRTTTGTEYIISKEDADNDGYRLLFTSSNTVQCSEDATDVTSTSTITDTNWHLVGCTIDRDGNGQVYIDGRADGSTVSMGSDAMATTSNITFGTRSYTSTSYLNGQIDDVRIYNYALTAAQVKDIYNGGAINFGPVSGSP